MRKMLPVLALFAAFLLALAAHGATYMTVTGAKQGVLKGEATTRDHKDAILVLGFTLELDSPRDAATGLATGKRVHKPLVVTKEIDACSPQLFAALVSNEVLKTVTLEVAKPGVGGTEMTYYKITLTNATLASLKQSTPVDATAGRGPAAPPVEEISLTYEKIEIESTTGKTSAQDNWQAR